MLWGKRVVPDTEPTRTLSAGNVADSALAAFVTLATFLQRPVDEAQLRHAAGKGSAHLDEKDLLLLAKHLDLQAREVSAAPERLVRQPLPAIAWTQDRKYFLILQATADNALIFEPGSGRPRTVSIHILAESYAGRLLLISSSERIAGNARTFDLRNNFAAAKHDWLEEIKFANNTIWNRAAIAAAVGLPPVVLDLDGDGIELVSRTKSRVQFDVDNDGRRQRTGWVGRDDGFLALDRNGDGFIGSGDEISFIADKPGARGDLEGLAAFDSNGNSLLDIGDEAFADFRIWRDANQDGVSQSRELRSLSEWGIQAINLAPQATFVRTPGGQDNAILATTQFVRGDGSTGAAADVALSFDQGARALNNGGANPARKRLLEELGGMPQAPSDHFERQSFRRADLAGKLWLGDMPRTVLQDVDLPSTAPADLATADASRGIYSAPQLEHEANAATIASASLAPEIREIGTTMYGIPDRELALDEATGAEPMRVLLSQDLSDIVPPAQSIGGSSRPAELLEIIRNVRYINPSNGVWGVHRWASVLQDEDGPGDIPQTLLAVKGLPEKRPSALVDRDILQMIDAMAIFDATANGMMIQNAESATPIDLSKLIADVRAA